ncbi:hypothetical protein SK128_020016 [Halocaridina rubra]|uniref:Uncharacterized protein n=1 Tax=Halocaridina rubra TaxID=373956 RepID=A0AAN8ZSY0_HALRR
MLGLLGASMRCPRWKSVARNRPLAWTVWSLITVLAATALFIYQISFNIKLYLSEPTTFSISLEEVPNFRLPPISVCPYPPFEPNKLKDLGLNISGDYNDVEASFLSLTGLSGNISSWYLWKEAFWDLGQVVETVLYDDVNYVGYKFTDKVKANWHHTQSPLGPCLTLHPPVGVKIASIKLRSVPFIKPCFWSSVIDDGFRPGMDPDSCESVEKECNNTSCGFEAYTFSYSITTAFVFFHTTSIIPPSHFANEAQMSTYNSELYGGNYILKEVTKTPSVISLPQMIETSLVKGSCKKSISYNPINCFKGLLTSHIIANTQPPCRPLFSDTNYSLAEACSTATDIKLLYEAQRSFENKCLPKCKRSYWDHKFTGFYHSNWKVGLAATTTNVKKEVELAVYPLSQLFSDIGGSLGLFLGISLLYFWDASIQICQFLWRRTYGKNIVSLEFTALLHYSGILLMTAGTFIHGLETIKAFLTQPVFTAVYVGSPVEGRGEGSIHEAVARRLASRALDCQPYESEERKCQVQCLLEKAVSEGTSVTPFMNVDGLPYCHNTELSVPRYDYIVPAELFMASTLAETIDYCNSTCKVQGNQNGTEDEQHSMHVNQKYYMDGILKLICGFGGICGLYLGYSLIDAVKLLKGTVLVNDNWFAKSTKRLCSLFPSLLKFAVFGIGLSAVYLQAQSFLLHHQITSWVNKNENDTRIVPLELIVCRWPPFNFDRLAKSLNSDIREKDLRKLPKEKRLPEIINFMNAFPGNWSNTLEDIWKASAWTIKDTIEAYITQRNNGSYTGAFCDTEALCLGAWKPVITQMNQCFSTNVTDGNSFFKEVILIFPQSVEKIDLLGYKPQIFFTLNEYGKPPLMTNMLPKRRYESVKGSFHSSDYANLHHAQKSEGYEYCIHTCMTKKISDKYDCRLPYTAWKDNVQLCNETQYRSVPSYFRGLYGIGQSLTALADVPQADDLTIPRECYFRCRQHHKSFYAFTKDSIVIDIYPSFTLRFSDPRVRTLLVDIDRHTIPQLLSDLGGIAGTALGIAVLYLLKDLLPDVSKCNSKEKNK